MSPGGSHSFVFPEEEFTPDYFFSNPIEDDVRADVYSSKPIFAFNNLDLTCGGKYSFDCNELSAVDAKILLKKLKEISALTINELIDDSDHDLHFHIHSRPNKNIIELLKSLSGKSYLEPETIPTVAQFGLYTHKLGADRGRNQKSPRIICIIGPNAIIHLLYFDPFHEICPGIT